MTLHDRYLTGDNTQVYDDIYALGKSAFTPDYFGQIELVLNETFKRVAFNLDIIYHELVKIDYKFVTNIVYDWQRPIMPPEAEFEDLLANLNSKIKDAGQIPLSLEYFYRIVGSCNFCWDWGAYPDIPWEGADPIDIPPLSTLISDLVYEDYDRNDVLLAGDYLQKDNISGSCYSIELTPSKSVDSQLLGWDMNFIEYLRLTMKNCGFTMADQCDYNTLSSFCNSVRPKLLDI